MGVTHGTQPDQRARPADRTCPAQRQPAAALPGARPRGGAAGPVWLDAERERFLARGYPAALAELWSLCSRDGHAEKHLAALGLPTAALRRLRYLELPAWEEVAAVARALCRDEDELRRLEG